jgi:hypothetical protein
MTIDARTEQVSSRWAWRAFWTPAVGGMIVALTFTIRPVYYWLLSEDHVIEWLQFAFCLLAAMTAATAAAGLARQGRWLSATALLAMALGCAGLAGEEISWAQRVFGFASVNGNRQGELNLHNVDSGGGLPIEHLFRLSEMMIGLVGTVLPLLTRWHPGWLRAEFWRTVSPPLFLIPGFLAIFGYRFFRVLYPPAISAIVKYQEWAEVCLYGGLAVMAILIQIRVSTGATETSPAQISTQISNASSTKPGPESRTAAYRRLALCTAAVAALTLVFAFLTMLSGTAPGNV